MLQNRRFRLLLQLVIATLALLVFAAALSNLRLQPGESLNLFQLLVQAFRRPALAPAADLPGSTAPFLALIRIFIWIAIPAAVVYAFVSPRFRRRLLHTLIWVVVLVIALDRLRQLAPKAESEAESEGIFGNGVEGTGLELPTPPDFVASPPAWLILSISLALVFTAVAVVWFLWSRLRPEPDLQAELVQTAEQTLAHLDGGGDVSDAVLRCYADMNQLFGRERQLERRRAMTPREFEAHLAGAGIADEHIQRLTRLFEPVRYGARSADARMALEARACLQAIVDHYGGGR